MDKYNQIIDELKGKYEKNSNVLALCITGSVAREEAILGNDLDIILLTQEEVDSTEYRVGEILVEVGATTVDRALSKLEANPMYVYMWLDAKAIYDKHNSLQEIKGKATEVLNNYSPRDEDKRALKKWLTSVIDKINVAEKQNNQEKIGFLISNVLWKIIEGLYMINSKPVPASTSAYREVSKLENLPDQFEIKWKTLLTGNVEQRSNITIEFLQFLTKLI
jgi:hypothetical protein